jgi:hypothetical protein
MNARAEKFSRESCVGGRTSASSYRTTLLIPRYHRLTEEGMGERDEDTEEHCR